jgi:uncharacterized protein YciI
VKAQYAYFYLMRPDGERVPDAVSEHVAHWRALALEGYVGGPFEDRTGGLITFRADDARIAEDAVASDPFVTGGLFMASWLKRWSPEQPSGR